jgi:hypothetical protein
VCTVLNSWWWTKRPSETCRLIFNKLKNCASNWFYYRNIATRITVIFFSQEKTRTTNSTYIWCNNVNRSTLGPFPLTDSNQMFAVTPIFPRVTVNAFLFSIFQYYILHYIFKESDNNIFLRLAQTRILANIMFTASRTSGGEIEDITLCMLYLLFCHYKHILKPMTELLGFVMPSRRKRRVVS